MAQKDQGFPAGPEGHSRLHWVLSLQSKGVELAWSSRAPVSAGISGSVV